jgi:hypothetical protein
MPESRPVDHPAHGVAHLFVPGSADSLVAAAAFVRRSRGFGWVTLAREHRLPILLERPLTDFASAIWCLGYAGTGNPLLPAALEAHATHRPVHWLTATTGRLRSQAGDIAGVGVHNLPGGSLVPQVLTLHPEPPTAADRDFERLGYLLGRYSGAQPDADELRLINRLHAASVQVRNQERSGAALVRELAANPIAKWSTNATLLELAAAGEDRIRRSRRVLVDVPPALSVPDGPAIWIVRSGSIDRGAHGKALASRCFARQQPTVLIEETRRGRWTKAWVVLPDHARELWPWLMHEAARFSDDFSYTGLRGAGAIPAGQEQDFADALWPLLAGPPAAS